MSRSLRDLHNRELEHSTNYEHEPNYDDIIQQIVNEYYGVKKDNPSNEEYYSLESSEDEDEDENKDELNYDNIARHTLDDFYQEDFETAPEKIRKYIEHKPMSSYPKSIKDEIQLLSVSLDQPAVPFGSAIYRIQQFPGDVDLIENIKEDGTDDGVYNNFIKAMKNVVHRIQKKKMHYYSEIKAGLDLRYNINVGRLENGYYFRGDMLLQQLNDLYDNKLIEEKDFLTIVKVINGISANDYDIIYNIIRKYYVLRWTASEFLAGKKKLLGKTITLKEASYQVDTLFKIDEITLIQGKFAEVTNAYILSSTNMKKNNILHEVIGNSNFGLITGLQEEVEKLYYSDMFYNPFKVIKRMFAMSQSPLHNDHPEWVELLEKLIPFISSTTSLLYQIKSELDSILTIMEKIKTYPKATVNQQIDGMKFRLANFINIPQAELKSINLLVDLIVSLDDKNIKKISIEKLTSIIKKYINHETITYMNSVNINPPPRFTMPKYDKYDRSKVRFPDSDPIDPMTLVEKNVSTGSGYQQNDTQLALLNTIRNKYRI